MVKLFERAQKALKKITTKKRIPTVSVSDLPPSMYNGQNNFDQWEHSIYDGGKFIGGFGPIQLQNLDYWTLRKRSAQLFTENLYARGLIRRLITNEISTGLTPQASPNEKIIGVPEDSLSEWTETVENRFAIWGKDPEVCDYKKQETFGGIQRAARMEALIAGDVLVVLRFSQKARTPQIQLIGGESVRTPFEDVKIREGHTIKHGVEIDKIGRHVAYWVFQDDGTSKRLPVRAKKTGKKLAWLVYGVEKRIEQVRGIPLLSLVLQSLKEIDRYRDATHRRAVINSILSMFIKKTEPKMSSLPLTGGAQRKVSGVTSDSGSVQRKWNIAEQNPGMVIEELQHGEEPVGYQGHVEVDYQKFEEALLSAVAWGNEIPPEILKLGFSSNYSASQAAINEFKIYLNLVWSRFGESFCQPIFVEWLLAESLSSRINSDGLLQAWRNQSKYDVYGAWTLANWYGNVKPSSDPVKQGKAAEILLKLGLTNHQKLSLELTGTNFLNNVKKLKKENSALAEALRPMLELEREFGIDQTNKAAAQALENITNELGEKIEEF